MSFSEKELKMMPKQDGFHLRGIEMTRLETFLDAAFAFATTMLVVSIGKVPNNYQQLILALKDIPSFLLSFSVIMIFWIGHRKWSRRYGLEDMPSILISLCLIFFLLVYIYPLRLMFSVFFGWLSGGWFPSQFLINSRSELIGLFIIYGLGLTAIAGMMFLLYLRARKAKELLKLTALEVIKTNSDITAWLILSLTGLSSAILAWLLPPNIALIAGFLYMTIPITMPLVGVYYSKQEKNIVNEKSKGKT